MTSSLADLVELLENHVRQQEPGNRGGAVVQQHGSREVAIHLAGSLGGRRFVDRWREQDHDGGIRWPANARHLEVLFLGDIGRNPGPGVPNWLLVGPLVDRGLALETRMAIVWRRGSPCWGEWIPGWAPKVSIIDPPRVRSEHLFQSWRDLELIARVEANVGRGGRPREDEMWSVEFAEKWRSFVAAKHRRPKQREMADLMGHSQGYLKTRFREAIGRGTGMTWDNYQPPT